MKTSWLKAVAIAAAATASFAPIPSVAQPSENATLAFRQPIPNIPGKSLVAVVVDYPPGGASPSHVHARSAFIYGYVVSGAIESQVNDGPLRILHAGESFHEPPTASHPVSRNASKTQPAKLLAVFVVDTDDTALTTPVH
jgi:quercetin dioxygenase-like cupin family protein